MGLFQKNPNEVNYAGGKKHFADVIKNTSPVDTMIWLNPEEDFNNNSTLIVAESEEALFFQDGVIESVFTGGKYKLSTGNYPFLSRLRNSMTGGISTFNCKVYFVNKVHSIEVLWGTDTPVQVRDPIQGIATSVRARGAYRVQVKDSKKFLLKMVGNTTTVFQESDLQLYFRNQFSQHIKSTIAKYIKDSGEEILGICAEQDMLAEKISGSVAEAFEEYGIRLINFSIGGLDIPDDDPNRAVLEAAYARRRQQEILGISWGQQEASSILHEVARNPGTGEISGIGVGMGMGAAAGQVFGSLAQEMTAPLASGAAQTKGAGTNQHSIRCPECGGENAAGAKFCNHCGKKLEPEKLVCPHCGQENQPGAKFCNACGKPLQADAAPKKVFCSNCGKELKPGDRFCNECGTPAP